MAVGDAETVARASADVDRQLREQGVHIDAPLMALSYLALSTTPALKITDRGLLDVERQELVSVAIDDEGEAGYASDAAPATRAAP
jgi:adenine deaminase